MLHKMCCRYVRQVPDALAAELELVEPEAVRDETPRKLALLEGIRFEEPRKAGKRTYDDKKFVASLASQIGMGKRLSDRQLAYLDSLLTKYADQIEDFESVKAEFRLGEKKEVDADPSTAPVLALMAQVSEWDEPVKRGKREFNDKTFYESLATQFRGKGALSDRQLAALKKMAARYASQIPDYAEAQELHGLPAPRKPKPKKEAPTPSE
jgi:hypothetical protein